MSPVIESEGLVSEIDSGPICHAFRRPWLCLPTRHQLYLLTAAPFLSIPTAGASSIIHYAHLMRASSSSLLMSRPGHSFLRPLGWICTELSMCIKFEANWFGNKVPALLCDCDHGPLFSHLQCDYKQDIFKTDILQKDIFKEIFLNPHQRIY